MNMSYFRGNFFLPKVTAAVLCLLAVLAIILLPGCTKEKLVIPQKLDELSLVQMWETAADATGVQDDSAELESLRFHVDENRNIDSLSFVFHGITKNKKTEVYFVSKYTNGETNWHSYESETMNVTRHPLEIFKEIDKVRLSSLEIGKNGLIFQVDFQSGDIGYSYDHSDIFKLEDGTLKQLDELVFHSQYPWCTISAYKLTPNEPVINEDGQTIAQATTTAAGPVSPGERTSQIWFLSDDINKAEKVKYLEEKGKTEYSGFIAGIQEVLPVGWEMRVIDRKGAMEPPHGLDEPVFRLDFVDSTHQFSDSGGRTIFPSARLYFYEINQRAAIFEVIEKEKVFSWNVPDYFAMTDEYLVVTSPLFINGGHFTEEAKALYAPFEKKIMDYFHSVSRAGTVPEPTGIWEIEGNLSYSQESIWGDTLVGLMDFPEESHGLVPVRHILVCDLKKRTQQRIIEVPEDRIAGTPSIYGNKIVFATVDKDEYTRMILSNSSRIEPPPNYDIFLFDLETNQMQQLTSERHAQMSPVIYGDIVVWMDARNQSLSQNPHSLDIYALDLKTNRETRITPNTTAEGDTHLAISRNLVVWSDMRHTDTSITYHPSNAPDYNSDIYLYDLKLDQEKRLTTSPGKNRSPDIDGSRIIWLRQKDSQKADVFLYDLENDREIQISHSGYACSNPSISGDYVVWADAGSSLGVTNNNVVENGQKPGSAIALFAFEAQKEILLTSPESGKIRLLPVIHGNHVVYTWSSQEGPVAFALELYE
jgi:beta propeller repeat protein